MAGVLDALRVAAALAGAARRADPEALMRQVPPEVMEKVRAMDELVVKAQSGEVQPGEAVKRILRLLGVEDNGLVDTVLALLDALEEGGGAGFPGFPDYLGPAG